MILSTLQISPAPASMGWRCFCMQETKPHSDRQGQSQSDNGCLAFVLQRVGNRESGIEMNSRVHFVKSSASLSRVHFVKSSFRQEFISSRVHFVKSSFRQEFISSRVHFVRVHFVRVHFVKSSFRQSSFRQVHFVRVHFVKSSFGVDEDAERERVHFVRVHFVKVHFIRVHFVKSRSENYAGSSNNCHLDFGRGWANANV